MENSTVHTHMQAGLEKVKRWIHQLERIVRQKGEKIGIEKLWARNFGAWRVFMGSWKRSAILRGMRPAPRIPRRHSPAQGPKENYEKYYKRVETATRDSRRSAGKREKEKKRLGNPKRSSARKIELLFRFTLDNYPTTIRGDLGVAG